MKARANARTRRSHAVLGACLTIMTGTAYAATTSTAQESQTAGVTMSAAKQKVRLGQRVRVSGRVSPGTAGRTVRVEYAPSGRGWRAVAQGRTGDGGGYRFTVRPRKTGAVRTVSEAGASSPRRVTVVARIGGRAKRHVRLGARVRVRGRLKPGLRGRKVKLQLRTPRGWRTVDRTRTGRGGRFRAAWRPGSPGRFRLRAAFGGDRRNAAVSRLMRGRAHVYRAGPASWYGPGFYGRRTACGRTLGYGTLGVAHKSLPCGTRVTFRYRGRSVTVPVIDRGPYAAGREWDLTGATKRRLRFGSTGTVWSTR